MSNKAQATIQASRTKSGWNVKVILGGVGVLAVIILAFTFRLELGLLALATGGAFAFSRWMVAWDARERSKLERRKMEADTWIVEEHAKQEELVTRQMVLAARIHETKIGVFFFRSFDDDRPVYYPATAGERRTVGLIEAASEPQQQTVYDAVAAVRNAQAGVSIVGPQQSSKTNLAMTAAYRHYQAGLPVIVIGYRYEPNILWPGLEAHYRGRTRQGLEKVMDLYRSGPAGQLTMVVFNDWLNIVAVAKDLAEELFVEAATQFISHNILPVFTLQADSRGDWGISDNGARLKDNFLKIEIPAPVRDETMRVIAYPSKATMYMPGDRRNSSIVNLPGKFEPPVNVRQIAPASPEFESEEEERIYYAITDNPGSSYSEIARLAKLEYSAPTNNGRIRAAIEKYDLHGCNIGAPPPVNRM